VLVALLVCLIPTTIGGLLSAIGIAGMDRMIQANVIATSGRAVEAAGDVDVLLLDKTGTITLGNRQATAFLPAPASRRGELADAAQLASLADETPEGRSIVVLAKEKFGSAARRLARARRDVRPVHRADAHERRRPRRPHEIRKGAADAIERFVTRAAATSRGRGARAVDDVAKEGGTPLVVADGKKRARRRALKDIVKGGIRSASPSCAASASRP
jgi:K+-transporting ATPase ATPase B chain